MVQIYNKLNERLLKKRHTIIVIAVSFFALLMFIRGQHENFVFGFMIGLIIGKLPSVFNEWKK